MRALSLSILPTLLALLLLRACRDASETLVGPPPDAASLAEAQLSSRSRGVSLDVNDSSVAVGWIEGNQAFRWPRGNCSAWAHWAAATAVSAHREACRDPAPVNQAARARLHRSRAAGTGPRSTCSRSLNQEPVHDSHGPHRPWLSFLPELSFLLGFLGTVADYRELEVSFDLR